MWTPQRISDLTALTERGYSASLIAERLGTTRNAVIGKWYREGISRPPAARQPKIAKHKVRVADRLPERIEAIAQAICDDSPIASAAPDVGVSKYTLYLCRKNHWPEIMDRVCAIWAERKVSP